MITVKDLTFSYDGHHRVLDGFNLDFREGGIYGLLGKNGTGKSTLLYLISGLLRPARGEAQVDGMLSQERRAEMLREMFLVPEEYDLPAIPLMDYVKAVSPFYPRFSVELMERCLDAFEMNRDVNLGALSMGQKKKVYMCLALATNTRYLLMDEPTNGLDILSKSQFRKAVVTGMTDDKTIIISTHQVHDVERLLDHVVIIEPNRVLYDAPLVEDDAPIDLEQLFINVLTHAHHE